MDQVTDEDETEPVDIMAGVVSLDDALAIARHLPD